MIKANNKKCDETLTMFRHFYRNLELKYKTPFEGKYSTILNRIRERYDHDYESYIKQQAYVKSSNNLALQIASISSYTAEGSIYSGRTYLLPFYDETIQLVPWLFETYDLLLVNTPRFMHHYVENKTLKCKMYEYKSFIISKVGKKEIPNHLEVMKKQIDKIINQFKINTFFDLKSCCTDGYDEYNSVSPVSTLGFSGSSVHEMTEINKPYKG
jgi:hypothetical protein